MKHKNVIIRMQSFCAQSWDEMQETSGTQRYCASCEKAVTDFTMMSDGELTAYLRKNPGKACGRFRNDQLNRTLLFPAPPKKSNTALKWIASTLVFAAAAGSAKAQSAATTTPQVVTAQNDTSAQASSSVNNEPEGVYIEGRVTNPAGGPLVEAQIFITGKPFYVVTDSAGDFRMRVPQQMENDTISCTVYHEGYARTSFRAVASKTPVAVVVRINIEAKNSMGAYMPMPDIEEKKIEGEK